jgi:hypothetical protein
VFSGLEYNKEFEQACEELVTERDPLQVRRRLMNVEWILWEAIRSVFLQVGSVVAAAIILPILYLNPFGRGWIIGAVAIVAFLLISFSVYWVCRAIFHYEISRHIRSRRFGAGGFTI